MGESPMNEESLMSASNCAALILEAIEKNKRNVIMTFTGKRTVFFSRFLPRIADRLIHKYFFKDGKLIK